MKNILIILPTTRLGGAEQFLKMVGRYYANQGDKILILFLKKEKINGWIDLEGIENIEIVYVNNKNSEILGWPGIVTELFRRRKVIFDLVFTSHVHLNAAVGIFRKLRILKSRFIIGRESTSAFLRYDGFILYLHLLFYNLGYPSLDLLICQTFTMKDQLLNRLPWLEKTIKVEVISNPIDLKHIFEKSTEIINLTDKKPFLVTAGRLNSVKGFDLLIEAFSEFVKKRPQYNLIILGEGSERNNLSNLVKELKLEGMVFMPGIVDNVLPYFNQAEMCIVSSRIEGFPNVLLQMMTQNENIVSTLCAGDISIIPGISTCEPGNSNLLYEAIESNLLLDKGNTRNLFDQYLQERSINSFIKKVQDLVIK